MRFRPGRAPLPQGGRRAGLVILFLSTCLCGTAPWAGGEGAGSSDAEHGNDTIFHLDVRHPSVQQAIEPEGASVQRYKFVRIEVAEVTNPKRHPLTFELRYRSKAKVDTFLGAFSLYPADNPGTFIVPTLGRLKDEGAIMLSMVTPDLVGDRDALSVTIKRMTFVNG